MTLVDLERRLKSHDWYASYSDDGSVVRRAEADWREIKAALDGLPEDKAHALFILYKPVRSDVRYSR